MLKYNILYVVKDEVSKYRGVAGTLFQADKIKAKGFASGIRLSDAVQFGNKRIPVFSYNGWKLIVCCKAARSEDTLKDILERLF